MEIHKYNVTATGADEVDIWTKAFTGVDMAEAILKASLTFSGNDDYLYPITFAAEEVVYEP